jgi:hypothetical protein
MATAVGIIATPAVTAIIMASRLLLARSKSSGLPDFLVTLLTSEN